VSYRLRIRLAEAAQWYNERQLGLGEKFIREVDETIVRILENPLAFPIILGRHDRPRVDLISDRKIACKRMISSSSVGPLASTVRLSMARPPKHPLDWPAPHQ
jgi:hypothetical protein